MSAISAGLLIYAATVEMIAGDFVLGDVEGGHHHLGPGHGHDHDHGHEESRGRNGGGGGGAEEGEGGGEGGKRRGQPTVGKKVVAVVSLFAGVLGMVVIGLGELSWVCRLYVYSISIIGRIFFGFFIVASHGLKFLLIKRPRS
ncbi:hypothetical protein B0H34DRAFT_801335 [Crassisporium funariophilum]|nr:hypothetical protein B0H34DRAFT_801335 [Crassisporium funariophilum]